MEADPAGRTEETGADAANFAPPGSAESVAGSGDITGSEAPPATAARVGRGPKPARRSGFLKTRRTALLILLCAVLVSSFIYLRHRAYIMGRLKAGTEKAKEVLTGQPPAPLDPYAEAVAKVVADRGEATGRAAQAEVPAELKQYRQPRRFLAVQSASAAEAGVHTPHDFAELAGMIKGGRDFVEAPRLGRGYVLYGVGLTATGELTHYDAARKKSVPLFANQEEFSAAREGLAAERGRVEAELKASEDGLKQEAARKDKAERARLLAEVAARRKELAGLKEREELIASYYGKAAAGDEPARRGKAAGVGTAGDANSPKPSGVEKSAGRAKRADGKKAAVREKGARTEKAARAEAAAGREKAAEKEKGGGRERGGGAERLFAEYATLAELARDFGGREYDLRDRASAREFQARLLSYVRPPALSVLEELGTAYQAKFERPLPVTSLVRTDEYQRLLRESGNPNAADVAPPPHTTGLAFDVYYRFMTAAEQEFVMGEIARLEREGRVEALRELRDHYHVFVFPEGRRPEEKSVEKILRGRGKKG